MIRILIVDDQNLVQQGIKSLLDRDMDLKVIGTVKDGRNAVQQIAQIHPDIVLLDIEMPGMDGITTTKYINRVSPKTKVIILSSHEEKKYVTQALMAGAKGYLLKSSLMTDLKQAILAVNNGYSQIDSRLLAKVFDPQNIKAKNKNLKRGISAVQSNSLDRETLDRSSPDRDSVDRQTEPEKLKNSVYSIESDRGVLPLKTETTAAYESAFSESDTAIQSESSPTPPKVTVNRSKPTDSSVSKHTESDENSARATQANSYPQKSPVLVSHTAITPVKRKSFKRRRRARFFGRVLSPKISLIVGYIATLSDNAKISVYKPKIKRLKAQLKQYTRLSSSIDRKPKQGMLWNIGLVIFGILVVLIFSRL